MVDARTELSHPGPVEFVDGSATDTRVRSFTLLPSSYCNMGCDYCGQTHHPGGWTADLRNAAVARVVDAVRDPRCEAVTVRWFGGEPLANYPAVVSVGSAIADECRRTGTQLVGHMVTNGSLLTGDRLKVLAHDCSISTYEITIDGPEPIHDARRLLKNGAKSYRRILDMVSRALGDPELDGVTFSLRTNIDRRNADFIDGYLVDLAGRGLASDRLMVNLQPVHDWSNDTSPIRLDLSEYVHRERGWMLAMCSLGLRFGVLPTSPKPVVCSAVTRSAEIIGPEGSIFSCSEHPLVGSHTESASGHARHPRRGAEASRRIRRVWRTDRQRRRPMRNMSCFRRMWRIVS